MNAEAILFVISLYAFCKTIWQLEELLCGERTPLLQNLGTWSYNASQRINKMSWSTTVKNIYKFELLPVAACPAN